MSDGPLIWITEPDLHRLRVKFPGQKYGLSVESFHVDSGPYWDGKDSVQYAMTLKSVFQLCNDLSPDWVAEIRKDDVVTIGQHGDLRYNVLQVSGKHAWIGLQGQSNRPPLTVEVGNLRKVK